MKKKISKFTILWVLLLSMVGCTTPSQWKADALVDELCAKDGGNKVYETVPLPRELFNEYGQFNGITVGEDTKPNDEYYFVGKRKLIEPYTSGKIDELTVVQYHWWIYRRKNKKLLGESISYSRGGGEIFMIDVPSGYSCPKPSEDILKKLFIISTDKSTN
jgi:hypothetical protein